MFILLETKMIWLSLKIIFLFIRFRKKNLKREFFIHRASRHVFERKYKNVNSGYKLKPNNFRDPDSEFMRHDFKRETRFGFDVNFDWSSIFWQKKMMMIFKQKIMIFHVLFWNTVYYPLSPFTECCSINQRKEELIDTREQNCCPFAGRTYNKTIEYCCGNRVEMVFNKNNKCCGPKNHLGKPYMDMASGCCTMPKVLPTSHYL